MTYKTYTISEFRENTRMILNEALNEPVYIKRHTDQFMISNASEMRDQYIPYNEGEKPIVIHKVEARDKDKPYGSPVFLDKRQAVTFFTKICKTHGLPVASGRKTCLMKGCK